MSKVDWFDSESKETMFIHPRCDFNIENMSIIDIAYYIGGNGPSMLVRSDALPKNGYETSLSMVSDWLFFIEILRAGDVIFINESLARYRRHGANTSSNFHLLFKEHLQTLFILESKYADMREDISKFVDKYVLLNASARFRNLNNYELKCNHRNSILHATPSIILIKDIIYILLGRMYDKVKSFFWRK